MKHKAKVNIARDECGQLRLHTETPYWIHMDNNNGFFQSDGRSWQLNTSEFDDVAKGENKVVWMTYELSYC